MSQAAQLLAHAERCFRLAQGPYARGSQMSWRDWGRLLNAKHASLKSGIRHRIGSPSRRTCDKYRSKRGLNKP